MSGGIRAGSGRPKGSKNRATAARSAKRLLSKEQAREMVRAHVTSVLIPLLDAQIKNALGMHHFQMRDEQGKWSFTTDPATITAALNHGEKTGDTSGYHISTQPPNVQAFRELIDRCLDKPAEQMKLTGKDDGPVELVVKWATPKA